MNTRLSFVGASIAFLIATACCWVPALIISFGGAMGLVGFSKGLEAYSGIFFLLGGILVAFGVYQFYSKKIQGNMQTITLLSTITCPNCGFGKQENMPTEACQYYYDCTNCKAILKPKAGDCCVYCSYGSVSCPPIQEGINCC